MDKLLILIAGGSVGTLARYWLAQWGQSLWGASWPFGTLLVNLTGCLVAGGLLGWFESRLGGLTSAPPQLRLLLFTGFLGAFTTFSSYELESLLMLREGVWVKALLYLVGSVALGMLCLVLGCKLTRLVVG